MKKKAPVNFHGVKGKSGRKPQAVTIAKRRLIENKIDEAEASFSYLVFVRDDENESTAQRSSAAIWIYEAVFGKAKQDIGVKVKGEINVFQYETIDRLLASRSSGDPSEPSAS